MPKTTNITTTGPRTGRGRPGAPRVRSSYRTGSVEVFTYPHHSTTARVLGAIWRWRVELLITTTVTVVWVVLGYWLPAGWPDWSTPVVLTTVIIVIFVVPLSRRFVIRRVWCVYSRHRVRKCFVQSRVMTHEGLLPLFMWTRPTPVGERLWLWLRPGLAGRDIENVADRLAAACWACSARVTISPKRASIVAVEVIRRDPLAAASQISSPLLDGVHSDHFRSDARVVVPLPDRSTLTPAAPVEGAVPGGTPPADAASALRSGAPRRISARSTPATEAADVSTVVRGWSGREDVSDYV
jgi:hypothetical protein